LARSLLDRALTNVFLRRTACRRSRSANGLTGADWSRSNNCITSGRN